ncbi:MAG: Smr/MutS family protein [Lautropia sp.]|nr:Smr/MutS family protein [Lautropia sp.]
MARRIAAPSSSASAPPAGGQPSGVHTAARPTARHGLAGLKALAAEMKARAAAERAEAQARKQAERQRREAADVFRQAVADVTPLPPTGRREPETRHRLPLARQRQQDEEQALAQSLSDEIDIERLLESDEKLSFRRAGVGLDALGKLRRGHWVVQAQLDLHGLRTDEAREHVVHFIAQARRHGLRCVRVIHGKGLGSVGRQPVLKDKVLRWLTQQQEVIAFCQAPPFAGGSGALLVLLRSPVSPG